MYLLLSLESLAMDMYQEKMFRNWTEVDFLKTEFSENHNSREFAVKAQILENILSETHHTIQYYFFNWFMF